MAKQNLWDKFREEADIGDIVRLTFEYQEEVRHYFSEGEFSAVGDYQEGGGIASFEGETPYGFRNQEWGHPDSMNLISYEIIKKN
jgi:hypothetical protein